MSGPASNRPSPSGWRPHREKRELPLVARERKSRHLYFYLRNRDWGLMQLRPQTWWPLTMQGCVNGREWRATGSRRSAGQRFYFHPLRGQALMDRLVAYLWTKGRNRWAQGVNRWLGPQPRGAVTTGGCEKVDAPRR